MNDQTLRSILAEFDAAAAPPPLRSDLAPRIRRRAKRRRTIKIAWLSLLAMTGVAVIQFTRSGNGSGLQHETAATKANSEMGKLNAQAAMHERMAEELIAVESEYATERKFNLTLASAKSVSPFSVEREAAAAILVASGDELRRTPSGRAAAGARYRSVIQLFPDTHVAPIAMARLKQLET